MSIQKHKTYDINQSPLYSIGSRKRLVSVLKTSWGNIDKLLSLGGLHLYSEYQKNYKDSSKSRYIEEPCPDLKKIQTLIDSYLSRIKVPDFLHSPARNCSQVTNAIVHQYSISMMKLDIRSYFESTSSRRVYWFFNTVMNCAPDVSAILTKLLTYQKRLPTGSPSSPRLAYFSHIDMWEKISEIAKINNYLITVYMDDITISGNCVSEKVIWRIKQIIFSHGLKYHKEKIYHKQPFEVTGIIVKDDEISAPNRQFKKRYDLSYSIRCQQESIDQEKIKKKIQGHTAHIEYIESFKD
jgi:hypothetical protein